MEAEKAALDVLIEKGSIKLVRDSSLSKSERILRNQIHKLNDNPTGLENWLDSVDR